MGNCLSSSQQSPPLQKTNNNNQIQDSCSNTPLVSTSQPLSLQAESHTIIVKPKQSDNHVLQSKVSPIIVPVPLQARLISIKQNPQDILQCGEIDLSEEENDQLSQKKQNIGKDKQEILSNKANSEGQKIMVGSTNSVILGDQGQQQQNNSEKSQILANSQLLGGPTLSQLANAQKNNSKRSSEMPFQLVYSQTIQGSLVVPYKNKQIERSSQTMQQTFPFELVEQSTIFNHEKQYKRQQFQQSTIIIHTRVQPKQQIVQSVQVEKSS